VSVARRPLLTATAAGTLLCALWFVPSANATAEGEAATAAAERSGASASSRAQTVENGVRSVPERGAKGAAERSVRVAAEDAQGVSLADTGSVDTTPYLIGGTLFLGVGAAFVSFAARRSGHAV
jgi:hypothetical protein